MIAVIRSGDVVTVTEERSTASVTEVAGAVSVSQASPGSIAVTQPTSTVTVTQTAGGGGVPYTGSYEVTPSTSVQTLATNGRVMTDDVTVFEVPYYETSNVSGITVYIASEV